MWPDGFYYLFNICHIENLPYSKNISQIRFNHLHICRMDPQNIAKDINFFANWPISPNMVTLAESFVSQKIPISFSKQSSFTLKSKCHNIASNCQSNIDWSACLHFWPIVLPSRTYLPIKYLPIKFLYCDLVCKNFMRATNFRFKADIDDVVILKKSGMGTYTVETKCFRPLPGRSFSFFFTHFRFREMLLLRTLAFSATRWRHKK